MADQNYLVGYTLRLNRRLYQKFCYVAGYECRSISRELRQCIKRRVAAFEEEHGEIALPKSDEETDT